MRLLISIAAWAGCWLILCNSACAGVTLRLTTPGSTTINSGDTVTVRLFLEEDTGLLSTDGLITGGARLLLDLFSTADAATVATAADVMPNAAFMPATIYPFDEPFLDPAPLGYANLAGFFALADPPVGGASPVLLADFSVTITGNPGETAILLPSILDNTGAFIGNFSGGPSFTNLDALVMSNVGLTFTISGPLVAAVPEPSTLVLALAGLPVLLARRKRRSGCRR